MASICNDPNGRRRILFVAPDGQRKCIRLGKISRRAAETIKTKVEDIQSCSISGCALSNETAKWVAEVPDGLALKLAGAQESLIAKTRHKRR